MAWHNPDLDYLTAPVEGAVNAMSPPWYDRDRFRSDSNQHWTYRGRENRCPHPELERGELDWLHLLIHPVIWAHEGATMRETMEAFLASERAARREQLRGDRIDLP